ncbi:hypothetical protein H4Q26_014015 [Puccinia striiformis f. sp. tritici PST-130]|nr:hypothetical protein H4Q26_014015 [Puccinia striiformis f. sp. tritici PST-130]
MVVLPLSKRKLPYPELDPKTPNSLNSEFAPTVISSEVAPTSTAYSPDSPSTEFQCQQVINLKEEIVKTKSTLQLQYSEMEEKIHIHHGAPNFTNSHHKYLRGDKGTPPLLAHTHTHTPHSQGGRSIDTKNIVIDGRLKPAIDTTHIVNRWFQLAIDTTYRWPVLTDHRLCMSSRWPVSTSHQHKKT